jgi:hypothetical protein
MLKLSLLFTASRPKLLFPLHPVALKLVVVSTLRRSNSCYLHYVASKLLVPLHRVTQTFVSASPVVQALSRLHYIMPKTFYSISRS